MLYINLADDSVQFVWRRFLCAWMFVARVRAAFAFGATGLWRVPVLPPRLPSTEALAPLYPVEHVTKVVPRCLCWLEEAWSLSL